ncbi:hypothetical protein [Streptomyces virginiae]|nr:hypothetical protein [Streptomyces virginiae]
MLKMYAKLRYSEGSGIVWIGNHIRVFAQKADDLQGWQGEDIYILPKYAI